MHIDLQIDVYIVIWIYKSIYIYIHLYTSKKHLYTLYTYLNSYIWFAFSLPFWRSGDRFTYISKHQNENEWSWWNFGENDSDWLRLCLCRNCCSIHFDSSLILLGASFELEGSTGYRIQNEFLATCTPCVRTHLLSKSCFQHKHQWPW